MKQTDLRQFDSLTRTQEFLNAHADLFGNINASNARNQLDEFITKAQDCMTLQFAGASSARGETAARAVLEGELRKAHMMPIAEFARAKMTGMEEGEFKKLTPAAGHLIAGRLVQAARGMAKVAEAHLSELEAGHFPADVVTQLIAATDAVQDRLNRRASLDRETAGATAEVQQCLSKGRAIVRTFGAVVKRTAHKNPGLLAEWRAAQRVKLRPGLVTRVTRADAGAAIAPTSGQVPSAPHAPEVKLAA